MEIAYIQLVAGSYMDRLGYKREPVKLSAAETLKFYGSVVPSSLLRMAGWMLLNAVKIQRGERLPMRRLVDTGSQNLSHA